MQNAPLSALFPVTDFVLLPKNETLSATLSASSIASIVSLLGLSAGLLSTEAAMAVRAVVALTHIVFLLITGTRPMSRLKITVDFSASFTRSLNLCVQGSTEGEGEVSARRVACVPPTGSQECGCLPRSSLGSRELRALGILPSDTI